jgi:ABC-type multidrug transport system ATPase subunit
MTFLHEPSLVLLDEPLNSLDPSGAELLAGAIQEVLDRGGAALWCSPAVEDAGIPFAGLYRLESGRLAQA